MEFMHEYSAAHNFFLYLSSTPTTSEVTTFVPPPPPPPPPPEAYDQAYYPTSVNDQEMMNFKASTDHIHPSPDPFATEAAAAAPLIPYNQVQFSEGSSMLMDYLYIQDINEDICSSSSYYFETSREAKVLRYKEKKKRRNFVKKIRYPSRKAYADIRPRIRGRFIKVLEPDEQPRIELAEYNQDSPMALNQFSQN